MKSFAILLTFPLIFLSGFSYSQTVFSWQDDLLILDNGAVKRTVEFNKEYQTVQTRSVFHGKNTKNFISENSSLEFRFEIDGVIYTGQDRWEYVKHVAARDNRQGEGVRVTIQGTGELNGLEIDIIYLLYPDLPIIRKQLTFRNKGDREFKLESLDIENLAISWGATHSWVYTNYARQKHLGTYVGNWDDPLVVVHDYRGRQGIALGNEAPGVTKRTAYHTVYDDVCIGLTHSDDNYAFRKWIEPNEEWTSPEVFIATYDNAPDASNVINSSVNDFTRKHMGIRLLEISEKPVFVYNTWYPFRHNINEQLIKDLADAAAECGIEEFIIDDGWQRNFNSGKDRGGPVGDWLINETKFPNGLSPVFNYMKEKGLKPGLWISIGSAHESAKVYTDHKEWFVKDKEGNPANLHSDWNDGLRTSCFSTDWPDYIKSKIVGLVKDHGLEYTKLDFAIVTSAYVVNPDRSGCYATNHPYHKDHNESFL
ncbi:MAG: glycoside hydrolase family 36 protein, partial [Bacteroidota bacterium]|nr:glycoside hydrolase family 36 protein [Bacteroidota bacterium]